MIAKMERGIVVTRTMGFGFDPVTGNFSRGAQGFYVENGKFVHPVSEITISRNLDAIFRGITAIANDLYFDASITCPSFLVDEMTVSGE